jgi:hypothetical protein
VGFPTAFRIKVSSQIFIYLFLLLIVFRTADYGIR